MIVHIPLAMIKTIIQHTVKLNIGGDIITTKTRNLGELFLEARSKYSTEKQKNPTRRKKRSTETGISHLALTKCTECKQGFTWRYARNINKKTYVFQSIDILKVKGRVLEAGFDWFVYDEKEARKMAQKAKISFEELIA